MGTVQALGATRDNPTLTRTALDPAQVLPLPPDPAQYPPTAVFLLPDAALAQLAAALPPGVMTNRGTKHRAKPLAHYLTGRTGWVCLTAGYCDPGQAERGVRALLAAPGVCARGGRFVIGIDASLFALLVERAAAPAPARAAPMPPAGMLRDEEQQLRALLDLHATDLQVPASLREAYLGDAPVIDWVRRLIVLVARQDCPVLIQGETGTGKEVVANQIRELSPRRNGSFVAVNCGGIATELLESELFGHVKGAFTGATRHKQGLWTMANAGTLFLDEIGDLSPYHQAKVLRALEGPYFAVGGTTPIRSTARIIAATNRDLARMVAAGRFREDLYYRLFAIRIRTPALREHPADIPELANHFWRKLIGPDTKVLPADATAELQTYPWMGNARELRAFLCNVATLAEACPVTVEMVRAVMRERLAPLSGTTRDQ